MGPAISFEKVSKRYNKRAGQGSLREALSGLSRRLLSRKNGAKRDDQSDFWALRDVSFEVQEGEVFGIVGHNGAGKTTILKLLSRVTKPTGGDIGLKGRVSALIELGAGFHPDLTGRENVYLNGSILGLSREEIRAKYDSIVEFAELEDFMDVPVKRYSSGMYARLGFSVAAHVDPDVLLVDEVLAVGDVNFQRKCLNHMRKICKSGTTVVFVSHNTNATQGICNRVMWLERGVCQQIGPSKEVIGNYLDSMATAMAGQGTHYIPGSQRWGSGEVVITNVQVLDGGGQPTNSIAAGDGLTVEVSYRATQRIHRPILGVAIITDDDIRVCTATTKISECGPESIYGKGKFKSKLSSLSLVPGNYSIVAAIYDHENVVAHDRWGDAAKFAIVGNPDFYRGQRLTRDLGIIYVNAEWTF